MTRHPLNASILIVTYNSAAYLEGCLASVLREAGPEDEIILVDNASTDGSAGMIRRGWSELALVRNRENLGFAAAGNQAARRAQKEVLVFLNPDTVVLPGWLEGLRQALWADQSAVMATSKVLGMSQLEGIEACGQGVHFSGLIFGRRDAHGTLERRGHNVVSAISGASFAVRRDAWEELGGFDATYWMYYEETDLSWRAWRRGYRCVGAPESAVLHDPSPSPSGQVLDYMARNRYRLLLKNFHPRTLLLLAPGIILAEAVDWGRVWLHGRRALSAKLRAGLWLLGHWPCLVTPGNGMQGDLNILEACTYRLEPTIMPGGRVGRALLRACNALFWMNYRLALGILRRLGR